jgi:ribonuclease R
MKRRKASGRSRSGRGEARTPGKVGGHPQGRSGGPRRDRERGSSGSAGTLEGVVSAHRSGFGFVKVEGQTESVFLPPPQMSGLTSGDRVRVRARKDHTGRYSGEVEAVLARGVTAFLATIEISGRTAFAHSVDRRLSLRCLVPPDQLAGARAGDWVIARITRYPDAHRTAMAVVTKRLDLERPVEMACETAIARYSLPVEFGAEALREAEAHGERIDPREIRGRVDLREMPLVTIDGEDARDFDDAVYAEAQGTGFRLVVAIADVSHYVRPGTGLDRDALERGTSVYFPNRVIPMLPTGLSNHLCSLEPEVDRLCFVADMQIGRTGQLREWKFYPAVMRSHHRLTYEKAYAALFEGRPVERKALGALLPKLQPLVDLYKVLLKARHRRGALDFESSEPAYDFDANGRVRGISLYARNDAHKLIEECMILANVAAAGELKAAKAGGLYRVHAVPEEKKLDLLQTALAALGIDAELPEEVQPRDLRKITERLGKSPDRPFIESLVVRSMPQAVYQPTNIGHFGLALEGYAHFTSPIRRYPDLVVHRALKAVCDARDPTGARRSADELAVLGQELSKLEKRADESDRYVDSFLKCSYLRERLGQTFEGLITTVVECGCFVQLRGLGIDGLLRIEALGDDEYVMESSGHAWLGRRTRRRLGIGTAVRVIVTNANPVEGLIDLELAE